MPRGSLLEAPYFFRPSGIFIRAEELKALVEARIGQIVLLNGVEIGTCAVGVDLLREKYGIRSRAGIDMTSGQFWEPSDRELITWFDDSPDLGRDCRCSMCLEPIMEDDVSGKVLVRYWNSQKREARFHDRCMDLMENRRP